MAKDNLGTKILLIVVYMYDEFIFNILYLLTNSKMYLKYIA